MGVAILYIKFNEGLFGKVTFEMEPKGSKEASCGEMGKNLSSGDHVLQEPSSPMWLGG